MRDPAKKIGRPYTYPWMTVLVGQRFRYRGARTTTGRSLVSVMNRDSGRRFSTKLVNGNLWIKREA